MNNVSEFLIIGYQASVKEKKYGFFEKHIFDILSIIYGQENLKNIVENADNQILIELMKMYGYSASKCEEFLAKLEEYEIYKQNPNEKTNLMNEIENSLINMFIYKSIYDDVDIITLGKFESELFTNLNMVKLHFKFSINPGLLKTIWEQKKNIIITKVELKEIVPTYLDDLLYSKYGTSLEQVKNMDYRMVDELNTYIQNRMLFIEQEEKQKNSGFAIMNTAISSGSGFVDGLLILSIIATEISLGLIYLFLHL